MREILIKIPLLGLILVGIALAYLHENQKILIKTNQDITIQAISLPPPHDWLELRQNALIRAQHYEDLIQENFLDRGMVIHSGANGKIEGRCDSLLFSSLRYVALKKLGWDESANQAWQAVLDSRRGAKWLRHPKCNHQLSRDMIIGLMAALSQEPPRHREIVIELFDYISANQGFFGEGSFHLSYLSPGLGEILRHIAKKLDMSPSSLPLQVRYGFSTLSLDTLPASKGFRTHLNALAIWLELELAKGKPMSDFRSISLLADWSAKLANLPPASHQRTAWLAGKILATNPNNLFYEWLNHRAHGRLNARLKASFLRRLLAMPHFPQDRLPNPCDRSADYLWQRDSREYLPTPDKYKCSASFHGVDFLWMAALILDNEVDSASTVQIGHQP